MESQTFRSRLAKLAHKSRKALRLYTSVGRIQNNEGSDLAEAQVEEWKKANAYLAQQLTSALDPANTKKLIADVFAIRDRFYNDWRSAESDLHLKQKELISSAEHGDFAKAALLSRDLVLLKARVQASQAAHHELQTVIKQSRVTLPTIELSTEEVIEEPPVRAQQRAQQNVIPLRR